MHKEHHHHTDKQGDKGGVKGDTQAAGDTGNIAFHGLMGLTQGGANTPHCAYKTYGGNGPGDIAHHGEL